MNSLDKNQYCEQISKDDYDQQSKDYTMAHLKELQEQLKNFKPSNKQSNKILESENSDINSDTQSEVDTDIDTDNVTININKKKIAKNIKNNKNNKNNKYTENQKDNIISDLIAKIDRNQKRMIQYSNRIKDLKKENNIIEERTHYLKLDLNNLTLNNDSLKKEVKDQATKINKYYEHFHRTKIEMYILKFIIIVLFLSNLYIYFS